MSEPEVGSPLVVMRVLKQRKARVVEAQTSAVSPPSLPRCEGWGDSVRGASKEPKIERVGYPPGRGMEFGSGTAPSAKKNACCASGPESCCAQVSAFGANLGHRAVVWPGSITWKP